MRIVIPFVLLILSASSCRHDPPPISCGQLRVSFSEDVLPLMEQSCGLLECHDMVTHSDGIILVNYERIVQAALQPRFMGAIRHEQGYEPMPKFAAPLHEDAIRLLECWIESGMPEN